jgi:DNA processing protein
MELLYQIGLTLIPGIGDVNGKKLVAYCGGVEAVFKEKKSALLKIPGIRHTTLKSIVNHSLLKEAENEIRFIEKYEIQPLFYLDANYPYRFKNCDDSPIMLYHKGNSNLNSQKILSIVGTRKISPYGKKMCKEIIEDLKDSGVLIVSGLAYGVDTFAHKNSLTYGLSTIGVLAHGLNRIYPATNKPLAEKMLKNGGLLTEFRSDSKPDRENFPKRNRIIAGLADAVLVIESARKGGAIITAEIANSYNRDVFAVPGRTTDVYSEGCNYLIKAHKASIIQSTMDINYLLGWDEAKSKKIRQTKIFVELKPDDQKIIDLLKEVKSASIDKISIQSKFSASKVASILLNLEFEGLIECMPGKVYKLN